MILFLQRHYPLILIATSAIIGQYKWQIITKLIIWMKDAIAMFKNYNNEKYELYNELIVILDTYGYNHKNDDPYHPVDYLGDKDYRSFFRIGNEEKAEMLIDLLQRPLPVAMVNYTRLDVFNVKLKKHANIYHKLYEWFDKNASVNKWEIQKVFGIKSVISKF